MRPPPPIEWRLHLGSAPEAVFDVWTTDEGRERFWAETSTATAAGFRLEFINRESLHVEMIEEVRPSRIAFRYFGGSTVNISIHSDRAGGCDLHLREDDVPESENADNRAGWISVLLALKAAVDFGVDLRGHDPSRSWDQGYVDN